MQNLVTKFFSAPHACSKMSRPLVHQSISNLGAAMSESVSETWAVKQVPQGKARPKHLSQTGSDELRLHSAGATNPSTKQRAADIVLPTPLAKQGLFPQTSFQTSGCLSSFTIPFASGVSSAVGHRFNSSRAARLTKPKMRTSACSRRFGLRSLATFVRLFGKSRTLPICGVRSGLQLAYNGLKKKWRGCLFSHSVIDTFR